MLLLEAMQLECSIGERRLFRLEGALRIHKQERVGIVGVNGAGKSTLMAVLAGRLQPDGGTVRRMGSIAEIRQEEEADIIRSSSANVLSGGERTRARIRRAMQQEADLLLAESRRAIWI
jgi:ATPase subunit of ABC transporter with duplicated ATPase domains